MQLLPDDFLFKKPNHMALLFLKRQLDYTKQPVKRGGVNFYYLLDTHNQCLPKAELVWILGNYINLSPSMHR